MNTFPSGPMGWKVRKQEAMRGKELFRSSAKNETGVWGEGRGLQWAWSSHGGSGNPAEACGGKAVFLNLRG